MSLNSTPSGERVHIGFFGRRNAGKSSIVNAVTDQEISVVSDVKGTTTDPVTKSMELLPLGPVVIIDTPGFDDEGSLGEKRVARAKRVMNRTDLAVLVLDAQSGAAQADRELLAMFEQKQIPYIVVCNKADLLDRDGRRAMCESSCCLLNDEGEAVHPEILFVSAMTGEGIHDLKERIAALGTAGAVRKFLIEDLIRPSEVVLLVIPIDKAAPKGRLILPQQMMIRGILDADGIPVCVKQDRLAEVLRKLDGCGDGSARPGLVITDSQVFAEVAKTVPADIPLTSFSILMARYKGFLASALEGVKKIDELKDGDIILISEGCTHHRQCGDIGTEKIPNWIRLRTGADIRFETSSGTGFPEDLSRYALIIHCGACMLGDREVRYRMKCAADQGIPFTNYGTAIAHMKGILERSTEIVRHEQD